MKELAKLVGRQSYVPRMLAVPSSSFCMARSIVMERPFCMTAGNDAGVRSFVVTCCCCCFKSLRWNVMIPSLAGPWKQR